MINNYFILRAQIFYLRNLSSTYLIKNVFSTEKNTITFHLLINDSGDDAYLTFILEKNLETMFLEDEKSIPSKNILYLFDGILNTTITDIEIEDKNRIITLKLSNASNIVFFAFPKYCNLFVVNENIINDCYSQKSQYVNTNIDELIPKQKEEVSVQDRTNIKNILNSDYSYIGKIYKEDILKRYQEVSPQEYERLLWDYVYALLQPRDFILYDNETSVIPSLTSLLDYESYNKENYSDVNTLIKQYYRKYKHYSSRKEIKGNLTDSIDAKIKRVKTKITNLELAIAEAGKSDKFKVYGDMLFSNIHNIEKGKQTYEYTDEETEEKTVIKLNPLISVSNNATNYYNKYKGMKNSISDLEKKVNAHIKELKGLEKQKEVLEEENNLKNLKKMSKTEEKITETEKLPFRIFKIDEKFEVWVGKDSASNDLLTMKYASQYDLWFHVRGSSGSHTILKFLDKNIKPEKSLIVTAASIAAYYSKARNGKHIPVAYCERKYVKKRKGFNQGAVVMEKEKVIFVDPNVPES